ncbi:MAG: cytochrome c maturation protein CcmE [Leptospiraceae bacterium]|nr:cytochrome c maturation protein CcmE [Leptospiraceae bacterium]MCP5498462.1 cytochrome c maturation protein CcmE [Leptospiraceae bacterium]
MKKKFILLVSLITLSLGAIAILSSRESSFLLIDTNQLAENPSQYNKENLRVRGMVKVGSLIREGRQAKFTLELEGKEFPVHYMGGKLLPDAFKEGVRVRVDGKLKKGVLISDHVEAKCASKYEAEYDKK